MLMPTVGIRQQIALQSRHRILHAVREVDAALDQHAARANRLRVLGHQRTLLGGTPRHGSASTPSNVNTAIGNRHCFIRAS